MLPKLLPDLYVESIYHIDFEKLKAKGIDTIVTDLDNTLVPWSESTVNQQLLDWLEQLQGKGFKVCLVSNAVESRIANFRGAMSIPGFSKAYKPLNKAFKQALELLGSEAKNTAMIGDQLFTDVLGGNRMGLFTILVVPLSKTEFIGTRVVRLFERWFLRHLVPQK